MIRVNLIGEIWIRLRTEFSVENLDFDHETATWGVINWRKAFGHESNRYIRNFEGYMAFRCVLFATMIGTLLFSLVVWFMEGTLGFWPAYMTNWALLIQVTYLGLAIATTVATQKLVCAGDDILELPSIVKATWVLGSVSLPMSCLVTLLYWLSGQAKTPIHALSLMTHGLNAIVMILDMIVSNQPYLLLHVLYFVLVVFVYILWSVLHFALGIGNVDGEVYIYDILNWEHVNETGSMSMFALTICVPLMYTVIWAVVTTRLQLNQKARVLGGGMWA